MMDMVNESNKRIEKIALVFSVLAIGLILIINQFKPFGSLNEIVPWVSVATFGVLLKRAYDLWKIGKTTAAIIAGVGSPVLSFAVYALGSWVIGAVASYGINTVANW
jgi:hypothetical protein